MSGEMTESKRDQWRSIHIYNHGGQYGRYRDPECPFCPGPVRRRAMSEHGDGFHRRAVRHRLGLDPECRVATELVEAVVEDPMTKASGAPVGEILEGYVRRHTEECEQCRKWNSAR